MSNFYTAQKDIKAHKQAQREREAQRQQNIRKDLEKNSIRGIRKAEAEAAEAEAEEVQARFRELKAEQASLTGQLRNASFSLLLENADPDFVIDRDCPQTVHGTFDKTAQQVADEYSEEQFELFVEENPAYYRCEENALILTRYLELNGNISLVSAKTFKQAYDRLLDAQLLATGPYVAKVAPAPAPWFNVEDYDFASGSPKDIIAGWDWTNPTERCSLTHKQLNELLNKDERAYKIFCRDAFKQKAPEAYTGEYGFERGEKVWKNAYEVERMSSQEYKEFARPQRADKFMVQPDLISDL